MRVISLGARAGIALGILASVIAATSGDAMAAAPSAADMQWAEHGRDGNEQRYSPLKQVTVDNVKNLGLAWTADMTEKSSWQGTPIVVGDTMYVTTPWSNLYAYDAKTGALKFKYNPRVVREIGPTQLCCGNHNRGAAYYNGKVIWATLDGRLLAVDAKSGKLAWEAQTFDPMKDAMSITGAPRVGNGVVFIGNAGGEFHQRGFVSGYDANTGKKLWKFFTVPGDPKKGPDGEASDDVMAKAAATWKGEWWKTGGGATVWDGMVYDKVNDLIIFGTGNGAPWPAEVRSPGGGDNWFTASIVALHAKTGKYAWHYQCVPMDSFDFDNTSPLTIADITVDGQQKHVVMQIPKDGVFYVIEAGTGKVVSAQLIVPFANWLTGFDKKNNWAPILNPEANYGATGKGWYVMPFQTHVSSPQSYSPDTGLFYVTVQNAQYGMVAKEGAKMGNQLLSIIVGGPDATPAVPKPAIQGTPGAWLSAWNPATQKEAWRIPTGGRGSMSTAGNLLFFTTGQTIVAYRADSGGEKLWTGTMGAGSGSGPMTYQVDGVQYVAALASGRVAVFKLGGTAALPPVVVAAQPVLNPPANFGTEAQVAVGKDQFTQTCAICHDAAGQRGTNAPDLLRSPFLMSAPLFKSVVIDGIKMDGGMKSFKGALSDDAVESVRAHLVSAANELKNNPQAAGGGFGGFGGPGGGAGAPGGRPPGGGQGGGRGPGGPGGGPGGAPGAAPAVPAAPTEPPVGLHQ